MRPRQVSPWYWTFLMFCSPCSSKEHDVLRVLPVTEAEEDWLSWTCRWVSMFFVSSSTLITKTLEVIDRRIRRYDLPYVSGWPKWSIIVLHCLAPAALYVMYKIAVMPNLYSLIKFQVILFTSLQVNFFHKGCKNRDFPASLASQTTKNIQNMKHNEHCCPNKAKMMAFKFSPLLE